MRGHIATKNGRYYPVISTKDQGTGIWKRKWLSGHKTKREAQKSCAEAVAQANSGWPTQPSRETVAEVFWNHFDNMGPERAKEITLQSYRSMIRQHLVTSFGAKPIAALTPDDLEFMMAKMGKAGISNTTIRYVLRIIKRVLRIAVRKGKLSRNVANLVDPPPGITPKLETWNEDELDRFITAAADSEYYEFFATLALTGSRRGEGLGLKWHNVDLDLVSPKISIHRTAYKLDNSEWRFEKPKTARSYRDIPLPISLALLLERLKEQKETYASWCGREFSKDDFVFARSDNSLPDPRYLSKVFRRIVKKADLKAIRLHDLRHTYATLQRAAGQPIEVISKVLGHASPLVTLKIYDHWEGDFRATANTMDEILEKASENNNEGAFVRKPLEGGGGS